MKYATDAYATATGILSLFRLEPRKDGLPTFSARWDAGKEHTIDIDLLGDTDESSAFKARNAEAKGYKGHHGVGDSVDPLVFSRTISTPTLGIIFVGKISLNVAEILQRREELAGLVEGMRDDLRIAVKCPTCGPIKVKASELTGLGGCPKCGSDLTGKEQL
ncbi:MAG: hypothetical protein WBX38_15115 [Candidatus Sulfotelmatobacter sp.]